MKLFSRLCAIGLVAAGVGTDCLQGEDTPEIKTVYLLPMAGGLDQYLAIRLTTGLILQVVTDPQKADAILTDRIGTAFEQKLDELYTEPPKRDDQDSLSSDTPKPTMQPLSRGKGAIFLVDRKTRNVVWSTYARAKNTNPDDLNHLADRIASRLAKDRKIK
jgi:hypothetical protein